MRENAETFLVLEAIIMEIKGVNAARELDPVSGMVLLKVKSAYPSKL
jgi:predicted DNA-binding protein with PD1-like motif